jgi:hypothetical protein
MVNTGRRFVKSASSLALGATVAEVGVHASAEPPLYVDALQTTSNSLNGVWQFRLDPGKDGEINSWFKPSQTSQGWQNVTVPHTWQIGSVPLQFKEKEGATRVEFDVVRPHRFLGDGNRVDAMKAAQETRR